jgi:beta-phosphoglucomutase
VGYALLSSQDWRQPGKPIQAVIFDLDGVICHTDHYHYLAWKSLADELGIYFDESINNRLRGVSRMESLAIILERYTDEPLSETRKIELATAKNDRYRGLLANMSPADLSPSVRATLDQLRVTGLKLAIGSSSKNAPFILERIGLGDYFDVVSDGNNITQSKPEPEVFLKAAAALDLPAGSCIVVEDAAAGVEAAHKAGMIAVAIGDAAEQGTGEFQIQDLSDLVPVLQILHHPHR